jgi:hypothetical protein
MDRQYEYVFVSDSNYHGFLSYCPDECIDQMAEEGMIDHRRQTAVSRKREAELRRQKAEGK